MQQERITRRQPPAQSSATNRIAGMGSRGQPVMAGGAVRGSAAGRRWDSLPPLTNGDPPPIMLWGEED